MNFNKIFSIKKDYKSGRNIIKIFGLTFSFINKNLVHKPEYSSVLTKIQNKYKNKEKIRVGFLVNENCKWNAEKLYDLLDKNESFEPVILITLYNTRHQKKDITKSSVEENYNFFAGTGKRIEKVYDEKEEKYLDIKDFDIDILFYQQPWGLDDLQSIEETAKNSLCCYFSYGIGVLESAVDVRPFHEKLFYYFVPDEETKKLFKKFEINKLDNMKVVGYPKLDVYNDLISISHEKKTIIYAPHHSYKRGLRIGTFDRTGVKILEYAKQHQEYNWIFKPHPDLKEVLYKDKKYGKNFTDNYYKQWGEIGEICDKGNYFNLFMKSDILITDCDSFLLEYMPTLKPIIRLERYGSQKISPLGKTLLKGIYRVHSFEGLYCCLSQLKNKNGDVLFKKRLELTETILRKEKNASVNIVKELKKILINNEVINEK